MLTVLQWTPSGVSSTEEYWSALPALEFIDPLAHTCPKSVPLSWTMKYGRTRTFSRCVGVACVPGIRLGIVVVRVCCISVTISNYPCVPWRIDLINVLALYMCILFGKN